MQLDFDVDIEGVPRPSLVTIYRLLKVTVEMFTISQPVMNSSS